MRLERQRVAPADAQQHLQSSLPYGHKARISVDAPLQFGKAQSRQQYLAVMLRQLVKNRVGAVAGVNGDISVEKVCQEPTTPSIPPTHRNIDQLPLLDVRGLWHAAQRSDCILQAIASGENRDDLTQSYDLEIYVGICVGELGRYANSLTIAGFKHAGPSHGVFFRN